MVAMIESSNKERTLTAWHNSYLFSGAIAYIVREDVISSEENVPTSATVGIAGTDVIEATRQGKSKVRLSGRTETVWLKRILLLPKVAHHLVFVFGLCDDDHTVLLTKID